MKKLLIVLLCGIFTFGVLAGCQNAGDGAGGTSGDDQPLSGELIVSLPITDTEKAVIEAVADAYMQINPDVEVVVDNTQAGVYDSYLQTGLFADDLNGFYPDIVQDYYVQNFWSQGKFIDLSQYLSEPNIYSGETMWRDGLDPVAYNKTFSTGEIYNLNFEKTQVMFFYNKNVFERLDIVPERDIKTFNDLVSACEKMLQGGVEYPIAIEGSYNSYTVGPMSYLIRTYVDQYFKDTEDVIHSKEGDWSYDPMIDADWKYTPYPADTSSAAEWSSVLANDAPNLWSYNELRILDLIEKDEFGPITDKYKSIMANLMDLLPKYSGNGYFSNSIGQLQNNFYAEKSGIYLMSADFFNTWKAAKEGPMPGISEIGVFYAPPMTAHPLYPDVEPDVNYTRAVGGPCGSYAVLNKNPQKTRLAVDFLKYWTSPAGQDVGFQKREELGVYIMGTPYIKNLEMPDELNPLTGIDDPGNSDYNPLIHFSRGLGQEPKSKNNFALCIDSLFRRDYVEDGTVKDQIEAFAQDAQDVYKEYMNDYLEFSGYRKDCLQDVTAYPFD